MRVEAEDGPVNTIEDASPGRISVGDEVSVGGRTCVVRGVRHEIADEAHTTVISLAKESRHALLDDLLRFHVLASVFQMDAEQWVDFLVREGSDEQIASDLPFASSMADELRRDPALSDSIEMLVRTSASLLFNPRLMSDQGQTQ